MRVGREENTSAQLKTGSKLSIPSKQSFVTNLMIRPGDSASNCKQLEVGNRLMVFALQICLVQASQGKFLLLERPDDPGLHNPAKKSPSVWKTALLEWFRQTGLFTELRLEQGFYHQDSPKPTFLLSRVTSDVAHDIELRSRTSERPKACSIGRNGAKLKEYTPQLCAMIAQLFRQG